MLSNRSRLLVPAVLGLALAFNLGAPARAGYIVDVTEVGSDVVASGSGTINTTGLSYFSVYGGAYSHLESEQGMAFFGPSFASATTLSVYNGISGPLSFGPGHMPNADDTATSGTGDFIGIPGPSFQGDIFLPENYVSGTLLNASDTWSSQTFSSLGLTPGTYTWTWGSGADADSFTMKIGVAAAAVPEPASLVMLGTGVAVVLGYTRRRKAKASTNAA